MHAGTAGWRKQLRRTSAALVLVTVGMAGLAPAPAGAASAPGIASFYPPQPDAGEQVVFTLEKSAISGESAGVEWQVGSGTPTKVPGTLVSSTFYGIQTWRATVPGQPDGTTVAVRAFTRDAAGNYTLGTAVTFTAREAYLIGSLRGSSLRYYSLFDSPNLSGLRAALTNQANFGPAGTVPHRIQVRALDGMRASDLAGIDLLAPGLIRSPDSATRQDVLAYVTGGGALLLTEDWTDIIPLSSVFGLHLQTTYPAPRLPSSAPATAAVIPPGDHPIFTGPFGNVTSFNHYFNVNWYDGLGTHGVALATTQYTMHDPPQSTGVQTSTAVVPPNALAAGSGPVLAVGDVDILTNYGTGTDAFGGIVTHPNLAKNIFAWFIDPSAPLSVSASVTGPVTEGSAATATGTVTGGDGTPTVAWSAGGAPCTFATPTAATSSFTCTDDGSFTFMLTATDAEGPVSTTVSVLVANAAPSAPGAPEVAAGTTPSRTGLLDVAWTASTDPGNDAVTYTLEAKDADDAGWSAVETGLTGASTTIDPALAEGTWSLRVLAIDDAGASTTGIRSTGFVVDSTGPAAPVLTASPAPAYDASPAIGDEWWAGDVAVDAASAGDPDLPDGSAGSGGVTLLPASQLVTNTGLAIATAVDAAGNPSHATLPVKIDRAVPMVDLVCPTYVALGGTATATWTASDGIFGSGIAGATSGSFPLDTSTYGTRTVTTPSISDNVGNFASDRCTYSVAWPFYGFEAPIDSGLNRMTAGAAVPLKFSLGGDRGLGIFTAGSPSSRTTSCDTNTPVDDVEQTVTAGSSSLQYNAASDTYTYVWKTNKDWAGTCRTLTLALDDGSVHEARFVFSR